jgi:hypothetical protein
MDRKCKKPMPDIPAKAQMQNPDNPKYNLATGSSPAQ